MGKKKTTNTSLNFDENRSKPGIYDIIKDANEAVKANPEKDIPTNASDRNDIISALKEQTTTTADHPPAMDESQTADNIPVMEGNQPANNNNAEVKQVHADEEGQNEKPATDENNLNDMTEVVKEEVKGNPTFSTIQINEADNEAFHKVGLHIDVGTSMIALTPKCTLSFYAKMSAIELPGHRNGKFGQKFKPSEIKDGTSVYQSLSYVLAHLVRRSEQILLVITDNYIRIFLYNISPPVVGVNEFDPSKVLIVNTIKIDSNTPKQQLNMKISPKLNFCGPLSLKDEEPYEKPEKMRNPTKDKPILNSEVAGILKSMEGYNGRFSFLNNHNVKQGYQAIVNDTPENKRIILEVLGGCWWKENSFTDDAVANQRGRIKFPTGSNYAHQISFASQRQRTSDIGFEAKPIDFGLRFKINKKVEYSDINAMKTMYTFWTLNVYADVKPPAVAKKQEANEEKFVKPTSKEQSECLLVLRTMDADCIEQEHVDALVKLFDFQVHYSNQDYVVFKCKNKEQAAGMHGHKIGAEEGSIPYMLTLHDVWQKFCN
jgi:hypothetical protein